MIQSFIISTVSIALIALFSYGLYIDQPIYYVSAIVAYFFAAPIILDITFTIFGHCLRSSLKSSRQRQANRVEVFPNMPPRLVPTYSLARYMVYSSNYDLTLCGIQKCHPAQTCKYSLSFKSAIKQVSQQDGRPLINRNIHLHKASIIPRHYLLDAGVSCCKLLALNWTLYTITAIEVPIFFVPAGLLRWKMLNPMLAATQGTVDACLFALKNGWCINMSGGYHHANRLSSGGFCIYPDITVGIHFARKWGGIKRVIIIDLDAHQGNGHQRDFLGDDDTWIIDAYNPQIYPGDDHAKRAIRSSIKVRYFWDDQKYLQEVRRQFQNALDVFKPELVVYNAGTDCMAGDPLGALNISEQGIIARDQLVFEMCWDRSVPVAMVLSGGYQKAISKVIGDSVANLFKLAKQRKILSDQRGLWDSNHDQCDQLLIKKKN